MEWIAGELDNEETPMEIDNDEGIQASSATSKETSEIAGSPLSDDDVLIVFTQHRGVGCIERPIVAAGTAAPPSSPTREKIDSETTCNNPPEFPPEAPSQPGGNSGYCVILIHTTHRDHR